MPLPWHQPRTLPLCRCPGSWAYFAWEMGRGTSCFSGQPVPRQRAAIPFGDAAPCCTPATCGSYHPAVNCRRQAGGGGGERHAPSLHNVRPAARRDGDRLATAASRSAPGEGTLAPAHLAVRSATGWRLRPAHPATCPSTRSRPTGLPSTARQAGGGSSDPACHVRSTRDRPTPCSQDRDRLAVAQPPCHAPCTHNRPTHLPSSRDRLAAAASPPHAAPTRSTCRSPSHCCGGC